MGHACNSSGDNCNNLFAKKIPDTQVQYTGVPIPALGICTGDWLSEVESVLLQKIASYATGLGISLPDIDLTTCALFTQELTCCETCTDLPCIMQAYLTALCTLYSDLTALQAQVDALLNGPYNTACLTLGSNPTLTQIIQELILEFCALVTRVTTLESTVATLSSGLSTTIGNQVLSMISTCTGTGNVIESGSGATAAIAFKGFVPVGAIIPYGGTTAGKFDSTGLGLAGTDMCGFALANGNNGTWDMREQIPVGAGAGAMGGSTLPSNASGANYAIGALVGSATVSLVTANIPSMGVTGTVTISDPGHSHGFFFNNRSGLDLNGSGNNYMDATGSLGSNTANPPGSGTQTPFSVNAYVQTVTTGITATTSGLSTGGSGTGHENRQPSRALLYIQRIS